MATTQLLPRAPVSYLGNQSITIDCTPVDQPMDYMQILMGIVVPLLFSIIVAVGFLGNLLVIVVIVANIQMRNTTNILIISLALADLAFIVFCVPFTAVTYVQGGWPLGNIFCRIYIFTTFITAYCSVYTLVLMSFDRYLAVVHPIESVTWRTERNTIIAVILTWVIFLGVNMPLLINSGVVAGPVDKEFHCKTHYCTYLKLVSYNETLKMSIDDKEFGKLYFGLFFVFAYLLPLIGICILYGLLIERLLFGRTAKMAQSTEALRSKKRVTRMVVIVVFVFTMCWLPIQIVFMLQYFGPDPESNIFRTIHVISNCLAYANSSINPILYAFLSENFRRAFAKFLCIKRGGRNEPMDFERTNCAVSMKPLMSGNGLKSVSGSARRDKNSKAKAADRKHTREENGELERKGHGEDQAVDDRGQPPAIDCDQQRREKEEEEKKVQLLDPRQQGQVLIETQIE